MTLNKMTLATLSVLALNSALAAEYVLTDTEKNIHEGNWSIQSEQLGIHDQKFSIENIVLKGGKQEGSELITITSKALKISIVPTRGMGILSVIAADGTRMGWDSPVKEVVNPAFINLDSRQGLGWLDGFNEMMVRCGYEWTGHAVNDNGRLYTLHGRAGNTPVSKLVVSVEEKAPYTITVRGLIKENTFKQSALETWAELRYVPGENSFSLHDTLTNQGAYPQDYQIIYHSNFGTPLLEEGATFHTAVKTVSPFNDYAIKGMKEWKVYPGPIKNFDEMVFNIEPQADAQGKSIAMLANKAADKGVAIEFDTTQLPVLTMWKNTDDPKFGYVTGIEPGTSYAYPVTIEREQKRVKQLNAGESAQFDLTFSFLPNKTAVEAMQSRIQTMQTSEPKVLNQPIAQKK